MQVMDMDATDTALAIALVHARGVCAPESSSFFLCNQESMNIISYMHKQFIALPKTKP